MKNPTQAEWNRLKEQRKTRQKEPQPSPKLPDDLFLAPDSSALSPPARRVEEAADEPALALRGGKRRRFVHFDTPWAEALLPYLDPLGRLSLVLLAWADFEQRIEVTAKLARAAHEFDKPEQLARTSWKN